MRTPWKESYDQPRQHIKKQRDYFANKGLSSQGYGFSSSLWMWELDCKESWALKNWCFWTVVLEKTLESPLDCKEIQPGHSEDQPWDFFGRNDAKAETPVLWPPQELIHWKRLWCWDCGQEKGTTEDEMAGWTDGREWTLGVGDGQGGLAHCNSWGHKESDMTERLNWTEDSPVWFPLCSFGVLSRSLLHLRQIWILCCFVKVTAAAAAKLLQLCPTLCDPIDGSPPDFPAPGILQARTLEWVMKTHKTFRTNTQKRCPFHYRGLECKSRKSRNTWSNRQTWPWNAE